MLSELDRWFAVYLSPLLRSGDLFDGIECNFSFLCSSAATQDAGQQLNCVVFYNLTDRLDVYV